MTAVAAAPDLRLAVDAMGTRFELVAFGPHAVALRAAGEAALEVIEETHRRFSRFEASSLLSHIHRVGRRMAVPLDADSFRLFAEAREVWRRSEGGFDPAWQTPAPGFAAVELDPEASTIRLRADVRLDLGAIAKGHGLELADRILRDAGVASAFLHGGTSSGIALGRPPDGEGWRVRLGPDDRAPVARLVDQAFSVSASLRSAAGGALERHLADSAQGGRIAEARRAAVVGPSARLADAWSTAMVVRGARGRGPGPGWQVWLHTESDGWRPVEARRL